jgi:hypothetical protein
MARLDTVGGDLETSSVPWAGNASVTSYDNFDLRDKESQKLIIHSAERERCTRGAP